MGAEPVINIGALRRRVIDRLGSLLETQVRANGFAGVLGNMAQSTLGEIRQRLDGMSEQYDAAELEEIAGLCERLDGSRALLLDERNRQANSNTRHLVSVIDEFNHMFEIMQHSLIERDLLERQSKVLEQIILSHERVGQWREFVQAILLDFHAIFPFDMFFVAFAEENGLMMHVYYMGGSTDDARRAIREQLSRHMVEGLGLPASTAIDYEEFHVASGRQIQNPRNNQMITVKVPEHAPQLAGLLGVTYLSSMSLNPREQSVIRSILAVLVMVVGSSKVLSRTLGELEYYAAHDPLTGLYNRRQFQAMLEYEIGRSERHQHEFAVLLLDLDDFKDVNDSYGHPAGDSVLCGVAETVREAIRKGDLATRIGGDEFALLLTETGREGAMRVADKLGRALRERTFIEPGGKNFHVTVSIGVVVFPGDASTITDLMAGVDIAMYRAKEMGKDSACSLDAVKDRLLATRTTRDYAEILRVALNERRIVPFFQPIVDCRSGELFACETVARMITPEGETIAAGAFIDTVEKYGLGRSLDRSMIEQALNHLHAVPAAGGGAGQRIFINLSAQEIQGRDILGFAEAHCQKLQIRPDQVVFEILERDAIGDMTGMRRFLSRLRAKGFEFALDDFGSGYNSFHYLRELHFEYVKIDGAFVRNIASSAVDRALVRNLSKLCQEIGIRTVAEFVESEETLDLLQDIGVDYVQGFHIGMPQRDMPLAQGWGFGR
ncbi:bifunctional diguanylate cyclase/phosphodiesterase [Azoarcus sp. L1K30]|nr:bifunctional diguanylate cyclase/phosphodiesterase [Azoarcus sp. L1K30]